MSRRSGIKINSTIYKEFKGVDFTTDPSLVDRSRSPIATNMISDEGGNPEKRCGYEMLCNLPVDAPVRGIHSFKLKTNTIPDLQMWRNRVIVSNPNIEVDMEALHMKTGQYGDVEIKLMTGNLYTTVTYTFRIKCGTYMDEVSYTDPEEIPSPAEFLIAHGISLNETWRNNTLITFTASVDATYDQKLIVHVGSKFYLMTLGGTYTDITPANITALNRSTSVYLDGKLFIFTGSELLVYDGTNLTRATSNAYVPLTVISCNPGSTPGGITYEGINYLSDSQRVGFKGNGTDADFHLPYTNVGSTVIVKVDGVTKTAGTHYNLNASTGVVTFTSGNIPSAPSAGAADNVEIQFTKTITGYSDRINKCTISVAWGINGATDRIVCSGNPDYPNQDFISGYNNGFYFPDTDYQIVGNASNRIIGYRRIGDHLAIIKEDNGHDSTVFMRSGALDDNYNAIWSTYPCLSGIGGVSKFGFGNIGDDQLVLTANGIYAITSNYTTAEKIAEVRSKYVNPELVKENLRNAYSVNFRNMMITFFENGHVYILDGRQAKSYSTRNETTFNYECYYWENCPATCALTNVEHGIEQLYFGTSDGKVMKFMWDGTNLKKYSDGGYYGDAPFEIYFNGTGEPISCPLPDDSTSLVSVYVNDVEQTAEVDYVYDSYENSVVFIAGHYPPVGDRNIKITYTKIAWHDGTAITSLWSTKADDDGDPMILKTMLKKGNSVTMKPYAHSSAKVCFRTDKDAIDWQVTYRLIDIFDWENIDFSRFTFDSNEAPREVPFNRKVKNYKRLQIIIKNDAVNEGFGIYSIVKHYVTGNFAKQ